LDLSIETKRFRLDHTLTERSLEVESIDAAVVLQVIGEGRAAQLKLRRFTQC
jgi:hypothetical protein